MSWRDRAACSEVTPDWWFPELGQNTNEHKMARELCKQCPVRQQCLEYALRENIVHGVWGGLTPNERKALRRAARDIGS